MEAVPGNNTFERIQNEIKESLKREDELKKTHHNVNGKLNGSEPPPDLLTPPATPTKLPQPAASSLPSQKLNSWRRFAPNAINTRGVMHKFLKMRGKITTTSVQPPVQPQNSNSWTYEEAIFEPAKVTKEKGIPTRNGYVSAEEKMRRELEEFQKREAELRKERQKSQPDLMAALELEDSNLKTTKSMANIYNASDSDDDFPQNNNHSSAPCSLKPARSLAMLCDISDETLDTPGTYSLIMQFEQLKNKQVRS